MQPVEVVFRTNAQGYIRPLSFIYQGIAHPVDSIGRQWHAEDGTHTLVMDPARRTYHLIFQPASGRWFLLDHEQAPPGLQA